MPHRKDGLLLPSGVGAHAGEIRAPETFSGARVIRAAAFNYGYNSWIAFTAWDTQEYDTNNYWDPNNPDRFTVPQTGKYLVTSCMGFQGVNPQNGGDRGASILNSAGGLIRQDWRITGNSQLATPCAQRIVHLNAGDYVRAAYWQNGSDPNLAGYADGAMTFFEIEFRGP